MPSIRTQARRPYNRPEGFVSISTIEELYKISTREEQAARRQIQAVVPRRTYRIKGSEAVWSPHLEAALLEGLSTYALLHPEQVGARQQERRNVYLSDFIYRKTNKTRDANQVGSRLHQIQGITKDDRIKRLIRGRSVPSVVVLARPLLTMIPNGGFNNGRTLRLPITVKSLSAPHPSLPPEIILGTSPQIQSIKFRTLAEFQPYTQILRGMDPTVVILAPTQLTTNSTLELFKDNVLYRFSTTPLMPSGVHHGRYKYTASVAADYWPLISDNNRSDCRSPRWSMKQFVFDVDSAFDIPLAEIVYTFEEPVPDPDVELGRHHSTKSIRKTTPRPPMNPFRYTACPPPPPTPESIFFPGVEEEEDSRISRQSMQKNIPDRRKKMSSKLNNVYSSSGMSHLENEAKTAYIPPTSNEIDDFYPSVPSQSPGLPLPNTLGGLLDLETDTPIYAAAAATQYPPYATGYPDFCVNIYSNTGHFVFNGVGETPDPKEHCLYPEDYRYSPTTGQSMGDYPNYEY
ncbi:hypothetical protein DFH07DRAFT_986185 [Mycena maculata]|uniref:TEA domain-containing protein n=1 Tax=Mycena maculata TaxID=230809 RepID=A0AAD7I852_9AGAR|nr:hypothetical protein DFH07DRAFT_986185 [Mycena maculata]